MRLLAAVYSSSEEFLSQYSADYPAGALFVATRASMALGERILCEIRFPSLPNPTIIRGRIVSALDGRGAWIACANSDAGIFAFVVSVASGETPSEAGLVRHHTRFPARVPVVFRVSEVEEASDDVVGETADLGSGGAYVRAAKPPKVGTRVNLRIDRTGQGPIEVSGRVAWARPGRGFGVRFDQRGPASAAPLRPLIRRIRETGEVPIWASATAERADESSESRIR